MKRILAFLLICLALSCARQNPDPADPEVPVEPVDPEQTVTPVMYQINCLGQPQITRSELALSDEIVKADIKVDVSKTYQTVDGYGASITGSTAYNLLKMTAENRHAFLVEMFDKKEGIGSSLVRVTIGSSDLALESYTWCDKEGLENFGPSEIDKRDLIPILHEIYEINPDLKIIAAPWSPPVWMKVDKNGKPHNKFYSGFLGEQYYQDFAQYLVKWVQYMKEEGFNIVGISAQNELTMNGTPWPASTREPSRGSLYTRLCARRWKKPG